MVQLPSLEDNICDLSSIQSFKFGMCFQYFDSLWNSKSLLLRVAPSVCWNQKFLYLVKLSCVNCYLCPYKSTLILNGESKSFSMACFVSFSERLACSVGIFQSMPRVLSRMLIPPSVSG